ncbi:MAG TPA: polysaccharide deacetylase family protein [Candidatus Nitrosopolaris sp.]|nr:polysaccharide deacetylase family protein [Candidatus Nitrosopolaris sp.]
MTFFLLVAIALLVLLISGFFSSESIYHSQGQSQAPRNDKVVILTFGDGWETQFTNAKPILDRYGFKASFFITCGFAGLPLRMNWQDILSLYSDGNDIGSKTMTYKTLTKLSSPGLNYEIGQSKQCLRDHGINTTLFATPRGLGGDNATVINEIAKYYEFAINGFSNLMYLKCDGWKRYSSQTDCRTFFDNGTLTYANRYSVREWSHNSVDLAYMHNGTSIFSMFVQEVNSQSKYNNNRGIINAIPIIAYHSIQNSNLRDSTGIALFSQEMKYLHDNNFRVIRVSDLRYNLTSNNLYIKGL